MAVHQTKKQSDLEKRLRILRQSLNVADTKEGRPGQSTAQSAGAYQLNKGDTSSLSSSNAHTSSDVTYLRTDLIKIVILSALAFGAQFVLYQLMVHGVLRLL